MVLASIFSALALAKYGNVWGCWCMKKVTSAYGVVRSGWLNFSKLLQYDVGDGTRVKF